MVALASALANTRLTISNAPPSDIVMFSKLSVPKFPEAAISTMIGNLIGFGSASTNEAVSGKTFLTLLGFVEETTRAIPVTEEVG